MPPVLALDFDGVISDSLLEAYLLTCRIAGKFFPELALPEDRIPGPDNIHVFRAVHPGHWRSFSSLVPFGNRAEDYLVIQLAVRQGKKFKTQEEFSAYREENFSPARLESFHEEFYRERYSLARSDRESWLALNRPFPGLPEAVRELGKRFSLAVATSKDKPTVCALLETYGLDALFSSETVLDKSAGPSKKAHLAVLRDYFDCAWIKIAFVDDKVAHLLDCAGLGVRLFLAGWGYNGAQEHGIARSRGIPVLDLQGFKALTIS